MESGYRYPVILYPWSNTMSFDNESSKFIVSRGSDSPGRLRLPHPYAESHFPST